MALHEPGRRHPQQHIGREGLASAVRWSIALNTALSVTQIVIGIGFGSLALIGDAIHNLGDVAGLTLGWWAERLSTRPPSERFTYGFGRSTQLAALINGVLVAMASAVVVVALQRLQNPEQLVSGPVAWAAATGIAVNLGSASLFGHGGHGKHKGHSHDHDLNRSGAVLHLVTDALVTAALLVSAVLVGATDWHWLDPLTAIGVGLAVGYTGVMLIRDAVVVLIDGMPHNIKPEQVRETLLAGAQSTSMPPRRIEQRPAAPASGQRCLGRDRSEPQHAAAGARLKPAGLSPCSPWPSRPREAGALCRTPNRHSRDRCGSADAPASAPQSRAAGLSDRRSSSRS